MNEREILATAIKPNKGETAIEFCARVVAERSFGAWDDGDGPMLIDTFSASGVNAVVEKLGPNARAKAETMPMLTLVTVCLKVINKANAK